MSLPGIGDDGCISAPATSSTADRGVVHAATAPAAPTKAANVGGMVHGGSRTVSTAAGNGIAVAIAALAIDMDSGAVAAATGGGSISFRADITGIGIHAPIAIEFYTASFGRYSSLSG